MGTTSSKELTPEQRDIKHLGERMPFGDQELFHIYRAYHALLKSPKRLSSFLTDIGALTFGASTGNLSDERLVLLQAMEQKILPKGFGNRLYKTCFLVAKDLSEYENDEYKSTNGGSQQEQVFQDEYSRMARLEKFFDGLSNCGRRGTKETVFVLVECCQPQKAPETTITKSTQSAQGSQENTTKIDPMELVDLGYRVALASAFLQATSRENEDDVGRFLPKEGASQSTALLALANSLIDCATRRKQRIERSSTPNTQRVKFVDAADVMEWAETVAPLFASSLATLTHTIFFPKQPYPPSRTSFDYPRLSSESIFFDHGSSPLLFSFGCMSSALSGEVRGMCVRIAMHFLFSTM
jgi:hypothetical protein